MTAEAPIPISHPISAEHQIGLNAIILYLGDRVTLFSFPSKRELLGGVEKLPHRFCDAISFAGQITQTPSRLSRPLGCRERSPPPKTKNAFVKGHVSGRGVSSATMDKAGFGKQIYG